MSFTAVVDPVNNTGHGGRLSASRRTCNQNHTFVKLCSFHNRIRNVQVPGIWQPECNDPDDRSQRATLPVCIYTKPGKSGNCHGKVVVSGFQHWLDITVISHFINNLDEFVSFRRHKAFFKALQDTKLSIDFYRKRTACDDKNVRGFFRGSKLQKCFYFFFHKVILLCRLADCCQDSSQQ